MFWLGEGGGIDLMCMLCVEGRFYGIIFAVEILIFDYLDVICAM